jgi:hypothetical protein
MQMHLPQEETGRGPFESVTDRQGRAVIILSSGSYTTAAAHIEAYNPRSAST